MGESRRTYISVYVSAALAAALSLVLYAATPAATPDEVSFNRDIRPIMSDTCFRCHGPDAGSRMANMRLDIREEALTPKAHGTPIVPGDPDTSEIIQRIFAKNAPIMPPAYAHKELTDAQKDTILRWVKQGAKYEGHWAFQPVVQPSVPNIAVNPIDAFIQARLSQEGVQPGVEADRRTLIRRVTLDLTGLIPTPEETAAFIADTSADSYAKLVDRLLASPRYAEKRAVRWLDGVRFADTAGYHSDAGRPVSPYRDYVLAAFRDNMPFDEFTREQLAGDLLPNATTRDKIAAAYNRLGRTSAEGGVQPKEYLAKYGADRVRTLSSNWLGLTMGCAECHDHKFDPIKTKDFYAMKAFFADIKESGLVRDTGPMAFAPRMPVYKPGEKEAIDAAGEQVKRAKAALDARADALTTELRAWEADVVARARAGELKWKYPIPVAVSATAAKLTVQTSFDAASDSRVARTGGPGLVVVNGPNPDNETYSVTLKPGAGVWGSVALEVDQDSALAGANYARGSDRFVITEVDAASSADGVAPPKAAPFVLAWSATTPTVGFPAMFAIDGNPKTGWGFADNLNRPFLVLRFKEPVRTNANSTVRVRVHQDSDYRQATIGRFRVGLSEAQPWTNNAPAATAAPARGSAVPVPDADPNNADTAVAAAGGGGQGGGAPSPLAGLPANLARALLVAADKRSPDQAVVVRDYFELSAPALLPSSLEVATLQAKLDTLQAAVTDVMVTEAVPPEDTRILARGNWMDESSPVVLPAIPEFLGKLETGGRRATRLDLANWLVSKENPLTARTYVNRLWSEFFGMALSRDSGNLGSQGEWPSNPDLLDWLAAEFMHPQYDANGTHDWDTRHIVRLIVMSKTYRQSSLSTPTQNERDPENRLLAHQSRFRVEAESVRDIMLEISGLLVNKFGGPSVRPYQPAGYLGALNFPKREWSASKNDDLYRRGIYTFWQRTFLQPTLMAFDAPSREECAVSRVVSNTPIQALDLLNDPTFVEAARVFGQNIVAKGGATLNGQIEWAMRQALQRDPTNSEMKVLSDLYRESLAHFKSSPSDAVALLRVGDFPATGKPEEVAAMANVGRAIMNLHETISRD